MSKRIPAVLFFLAIGPIADAAETGDFDRVLPAPSLKSSVARVTSMSGDEPRLVANSSTPPGGASQAQQAARQDRLSLATADRLPADRQRIGCRSTFGRPTAAAGTGPAATKGDGSLATSDP